MKTLQQYPQPKTLVPWIKWHLREKRDVMIEFRGPKGFRKSSFMFHLIKRLDWNYDWRHTQCYTQKQYATAAKHIIELREKEDAAGLPRSLQILWCDDAKRIFYKRRAMERGNKAAMEFMATNRDAMQAVQFVGTQSDVLERGVKEEGPYLLILFRKPGVGWICWPDHDPLQERDPVYKPLWPMTVPNPEVAYAEEWRQAQVRRRELTRELHGESLNTMLGKNGTNGTRPKRVGAKRKPCPLCKSTTWRSTKKAKKVNGRVLKVCASCWAGR